MKEKSESEITVNPTATKKVKVQKNFFLYIFCAHGLLMSLWKQIKTEPMQCIFNFCLLSYLSPHISASQTQGRQNSHQSCYQKLLKTCHYIV